MKLFNLFNKSKELINYKRTEYRNDYIKGYFDTTCTIGGIYGFGVGVYSSHSSVYNPRNDDNIDYPTPDFIRFGVKSVVFGSFIGGIGVITGPISVPCITLVHVFNL